MKKVLLILVALVLTACPTAEENVNPVPLPEVDDDGGLLITTVDDDDWTTYDDCNDFWDCKAACWEDKHLCKDDCNDLCE